MARFLLLNAVRSMQPGKIVDSYADDVDGLLRSGAILAPAEDASTRAILALLERRRSRGGDSGSFFIPFRESSRAWQPVYTYDAGAIVVRNGAIYFSLVENKAADPAVNSDKWVPVIGSLQVPTPPAMVAAADMSGHRMAKSSPEGARYCDADTLGDQDLAIGITSGAALAGDGVAIVSSGEMVEPSWNWSVGDPVYCGRNGVLTQAYDETWKWVMVVGTATASTKLWVRLHSPVVQY